MPRLAIVISAMGSVESLEGTLVSVLENRPSDCEIIVALNQAYRDPYELHGEVRFVETARRMSPIARINQALSATRAPFVHLLASGCEVTEGWADLALTRFGDRHVGSVAPLVLDAQNPDRIFAAGVGYHHGGARYLVGQGLARLTPETQGRILGACAFAAFYRKSALDFVGGLSRQLGMGQADVDLALVLARAGFAVAVEPRSRIYASADVEARPGAAQQALHDERLFWRNLPNAGQVKSLAAHAGLVTLELLRSLGRPRMLAQLAGRTWACGQIGSYVRHRHALEQLGRRALPAKPGFEHVRIDRSHGVSAHAEPSAARAPLG